LHSRISCLWLAKQVKLTSTQSSSQENHIEKTLKLPIHYAIIT
jgi:hypothetical protein